MQAAPLATSAVLNLGSEMVASSRYASDNGVTNCGATASRGVQSLRHSREMTLLCSPRVTHNHTGEVALLPPGKRNAWATYAQPARTNWFGKNEWVARNQQPHGGGPCSFLPTDKHGQLVFFVWVTLTEHKWVILAERRSPVQFLGYFDELLKFPGAHDLLERAVFAFLR